MNSTTERCRSQSARMCSGVSSRPGGMMPWRVPESYMACSDSANVDSRSDAVPSRKVSSSAATSALDRVYWPVAGGHRLVRRRLVPGRLEIALEVRRVAELAELRGRVAEEEAYGPVEHQSRAAAGAGHEREVVGACGEPGREAAQLDAEHRGHGLVAAHVHEDAERLVAELAYPAVAERRRHVLGRELALAHRVLRRRGTDALVVLRRIGDGRGVAHRPHVVATLHAQRRIDVDPPGLVKRQPELADDPRRLDAGGPAERARRDHLAVLELDAVLR